MLGGSGVGVLGFLELSLISRKGLDWTASQCSLVSDTHTPGHPILSWGTLSNAGIQAERSLERLLGRRLHVRGRPSSAV